MVHVLQQLTYTEKFLHYSQIAVICQAVEILISLSVPEMKRKVRRKREGEKSRGKEKGKRERGKEKGKREGEKRREREGGKEKGKREGKRST